MSAQEIVRVPVTGKVYENCNPDAFTLISKKHYDLLQTIEHSIVFKPDGYIGIHYRNERNERTCDLLHRYIMIKLEKTTLGKNQVIHHKNNLKYDNTLENLQITTLSHNSAATIQKNKDKQASQYKGVSANLGKWISKIRHQNKITYLGRFNTQEEAAKQYDVAFLSIHKTTNGSNNLLKQEEVDQILKNPTQHIPKPKNEDRILPKCIYKKNSSYCVQIRNQNINRNFPTLQEAIDFRDSILNKVKEEKEQEEKGKNIRRNEEGIAIIAVKKPNVDEYEYALVDDEDWHDLEKYKWYLHKGYAKSSHTETENKRMHSFLLKSNIQEDKVVDHVNGNKLDNRKDNLRIVSHAVNSMNTQRKRSNELSSNPGVFYDSKKQKWKAVLRIKDKRNLLGYFSTEEEASKCYQDELNKF